MFGSSGPKSFNPTLVRLRPGIGPVNVTIPLVFQSHAGSIEAPIIFYRWRLVSSFQSHAGSIEAGHAVSRQSTRSAVSIPRWFD